MKVMQARDQKEAETFLQTNDIDAVVVESRHEIWAYVTYVIYNCHVFFKTHEQAEGYRHNLGGHIHHFTFL